MSCRLTVAAAAGALLLAAVAGYAKSGKLPLTSLGQVSGAPSAPASAIHPTPGTSGPTVMPTVHGSGTPTHTPPSPPMSPPTSPSTDPPAIQSPPAPLVHNDYSVVATGKCYWMIDYNDYLKVGAEFTFSYKGDQSVTMVPTTFTADPSDGYHSTGDLPIGTELDDTGGHVYTKSEFLGMQVKVTETLDVTDDDPSNNAVSITVSMPTLNQLQLSGFSTDKFYSTTCG